MAENLKTEQKIMQTSFYANASLYATLYVQCFQALAFEITDLEM